MIIESSSFDRGEEIKNECVLSQLEQEQSQNKEDMIKQQGLLTLNQLKAGETGKVIELRGGSGFVHRLEGLGIRLGIEVIKVSSMFLHGPVTIRVGQSQVAIGFGMASKIIVDPEKAD